MESLRASGIDLQHVSVRANCPNQSAYIVIDRSTGERTIFWRREDCLAIRPEEIDPAQIGRARLLLIDGHDTPAVAHAVARYGTGWVVPPGSGMPEDLPLEALRLPDAVVAELRLMGFDRIGPLAAGAVRTIVGTGFVTVMLAAVESSVLPLS